LLYASDVRHNFGVGIQEDEMNSTGVNQATQPQLEEPRFQDGKAMLVAGLQHRYNGPDVKNISALWQRFAPHIGKIPGQVGPVAYGLCSNMIVAPFSFDYMAGVEVSSAAGLPADFSVTSIPAMSYAIFTHRGHVSNLRMTMDAIYQQWLPKSGRTFLQPIPDVPYMVERYDGRFNPETASGEIELWIPIKLER
jgi:AraC family transcriptional regulator